MCLPCAPNKGPPGKARPGASPASLQEQTKNSSSRRHGFPARLFPPRNREAPSGSIAFDTGQKLKYDATGLTTGFPTAHRCKPPRRHQMRNRYSRLYRSSGHSVARKNLSSQLSDQPLIPAISLHAIFQRQPFEMPGTGPKSWSNCPLPAGSSARPSCDSRGRSRFDGASYPKMNYDSSRSPRS